MGQLTQLTVGHQWLGTNLGYKPTSSWAIDPFGLSPTMPYLYKKSGLQNALIQRVHYAVKKRLAQDKNLEFRWRQLWDTIGLSEILTHMIPFPGYGIQYSCGPDPYICYQFDFRRVWSWNPFARKYIPEEITTENLVERATTLLDQYRKKAQLYRSNVLLVPLGDDFRYTTSDEWDSQYNNYQRLFDYMNENKLFHVDVKFGTLTEYFNLLRNDLDIDQLPSLSGDFFTYADKDEDYWSGYYTSRPFHKRLDRVLIDALHGAEVISSIAWASGFHYLHHDGITGTARDNVVKDYAEKMIAALTNLAHVTQQSAVHLLRTGEDLILEPESVYLTLDQIRSHHTSIDDKQVLSFSDNDNFKRVVIYNSLPRKRERVQTLFVSTPFVKVTDSYGEPIQSQISPIWTESATFSDEHYELSFVVTVAGFGLNTYLIHSVKSDDKLSSRVNIANITLLNAKNQPYSVPGFENIQIVSSPQEFSIRQRPEISAHFSKSGLLKSLQTGDTTASVDMEFVTYETDSGGTYLFIPNKPDPDPIYTTDDHIIHLVTGPILSRVFIQLPQVKQTYTLFNSLGSDGLGLHVSNLFDITETNNF
ncbi:Similar to alpha-Man-IIa: Alpha-mannosidase 2 (Drosophila melanogaster) [Cotesia congregata]|uniref:mannosyl-oligosaccharide 1,3-1,6-alpha-mannosidase n=1 Tax=Cotesia congregata TaxID=51543 RepID=A0A8J2HIU5_COTCN|nr:Similar to alpha-Man-IIa: Alpha-mannosidase 2 (Drosophila melanogaster) [Cotesia congregata]